MTIHRINKDGSRPVKIKPCKYCGSLGHTAFNCPKKPRKPLARVKRMRKVGKIGKQWAETRRAWFEQNTADEYTCYLQISPLCPVTMTLAETTLDHVKSRGRHPELRFELSNLRPACAPCQEVKGSRDLEEL